MIDLDRLATLADAILYEGYLLYPYRSSALKNRLRWTFGCLLPERWAATLGEPAWLQAECLFRGNSASRLAVRSRCLILEERSVSEDSAARLMQIDTPIVSPGELTEQPVTAGQTFRGAETIWAELSVSVSQVDAEIYRLRARLDNVTMPLGPCPPRAEALLWGLLSCHLLLGVEDGAFISATAPLAEYRELIASCRNVGVWPVLAGDPALPEYMLAAPIILYDHPQIAPQSSIDLFDATEIDEMLRLRILTLTDEEKGEVRRGDERTRRLLERVGNLSDSDARALHGTWRVGLRPGDRVRLRPARRADLLDAALAGKEATVVSVDRDLEGRLHVGVIVDDDPGRDLGLAGWPGHRFFFALEEVEVLG
jgi:hypothetical protein